jgi:hypothetical protein
MSADETTPSDSGSQQPRRSYEQELYAQSINQRAGVGQSAGRNNIESQQQLELQRQKTQEQQTKSRTAQNKSEQERAALKTAAKLSGQPELGALANAVPTSVLTFWRYIRTFSIAWTISVNLIIFIGIMVCMGVVIAAPQAAYCASIGQVMKAFGSTACDTAAKKTTTTTTSTPAASTKTTTPTAGTVAKPLANTPID